MTEPDQLTEANDIGAKPLAALFDLMVCDLDGVVYAGAQAIAGAVPAICATQNAGTRWCYLTNNASRAPRDIAGHLQSLGVEVAADQVVTSAQVAARLIAQQLPAKSVVLVVGSPALVAEVDACGLRAVRTAEVSADAEEQVATVAAVVQGFSPDLCWRDLQLAARAVQAGAWWVATNRDLTLPLATGIAPGNGSLVQAVANAAGRQPDVVAGKPQPQPFRVAQQRFDSRRPLVVGDRLDTDIAGAVSAGMPSLWVATGISSLAHVMAAPACERPTYLAADLSALIRPYPVVECEVTAGGPSVVVSARCGEVQLTVADLTATWRGFANPAVEISDGNTPASTWDAIRCAVAVRWALADADADRDGVVMQILLADVG